MTLRNIFRMIRRDSLTLVTNMTGLSLALAASILLTVFIQFEFSFDKHFSKIDRIFRLNSIWTTEGEKGIMPINLRKAYTEIPDRVAGIETAVQIYRGFNHEVIRGEDRYKDLQLLYADPGFFQLFDLKPLEGSIQDALADPGSVVLTRENATRIFGTVQATGKSFEIDKETYTVSAVIENIPPNTSFDFDMLMPMESVENLQGLGGLEFFTYYLLKEEADQETVLKTICNENTRLLTERFSNYKGSTFDSNTDALKDLHLHGSVQRGLVPPGSMKSLIIMIIIAVTVMILALTNFINLYILNGAKRSKEIGIRKVNGARRHILISQFYIETTVVVTIAFLLGAVLSVVLIPEFGRFMQRESFGEITSSPMLYLIILAVYVVTIVLSGFYPALLLSKSSPVPLIRGTVNPAGDKKMLLRIASIFQISITIFLLSTLVGIITQTRYMKNLSPGYNPEGIVLIYNLNEQLIENYASLHDKLLEFPDIEMVAASEHTIGSGFSGQGIRWYGDPPDQSKTIFEYRIQPGICSLYQFNLVQGRFFNPERIADRNCVILNESAVQMLGSTPQAILGESLVMFSDPLLVIGVVEDFLYQSAAREVDPMVITAYSDRIRNIAVKVRPGSDPQVILDRIHETIQAFDPAYVMLHRYATDVYLAYYRGEERLQTIMGAGSLLSVIIVLLGIYALVSHNIISRTKEIGIRKVMGGSTSGMITLIYTSTLKWTAIASVIAVPLSWLYLNNWLNDYVIRIPLHWWIFIGPILVVIVFQSLITLGQTWKTARRNPVEALRYE